MPLCPIICIAMAVFNIIVKPIMMIIAMVVSNVDDDHESSLVYTCSVYREGSYHSCSDGCHCGVDGACY